MSANLTRERHASVSMPDFGPRFAAPARPCATPWQRFKAFVADLAREPQCRNEHCCPRAKPPAYR
jgi:hypothetical protein